MTYATITLTAEQAERIRRAVSAMGTIAPWLGDGALLAALTPPAPEKTFAEKVGAPWEVNSIGVAKFEGYDLLYLVEEMRGDLDPNLILRTASAGPDGYELAKMVADWIGGLFALSSSHQKMLDAALALIVKMEGGGHG